MTRSLWLAAFVCLVGCVGDGGGSGGEALSGTGDPQDPACQQVCSPYDPSDCQTVCPRPPPDAAVPEDPYQG